MEEFRYSMFDISCAAMKAEEAVRNLAELAQMLPDVSDEVLILEFKDR